VVFLGHPAWGWTASSWASYSIAHPSRITAGPGTASHPDGTPAMLSAWTASALAGRARLVRRAPAVVAVVVVAFGVVAVATRLDAPPTPPS
jgi:hypothetical protein